MMQYVLQTILFQLIFLLVYEFFLRKETFFNWNRAYLLLTSLLSFVLPLIKIQAFSKVVPQQYIFQLPTVVIGDIAQEEILLRPEYQITEGATGFQWQWDYVLWVGIAFSLFVLIFKITKIFRIIRKNEVHKTSNISLVKLKDSNAAFSFFRYVFIGENIEEKEQDVILKHELVHVHQKHSLDLLLFEILRVLFWYNPLIYIYQSKLRVLHEFIADKEALKTQDKATYYQNLLTQMFDTQNVSFINTFYKKSLIKKRIIMLQKSKSNQLKRTKYLMLIPMVFVMLVYTACTNEVIAQTEKENAESKSAILNKIDELKEEIAKKGNMTEEEERALKTLMMLITEDGLNNEFFKDVVQYAEIPFGVIENIPTYKECENLSQDEQRKCVSQKVSAYVSNGFNVKLAESLNLKGKQRINVIFKIDNTGQVTSVRARAPHPELEKEAVRVVSSLPRFIPGQHDGKNVTVPYSLPIIFQIAEKNKENKE